MSPLEMLADRCSEGARPMPDRLAGNHGLVQQRIEAVDGPRVRIDGRWVLNFAACNYLGLNDDPRVRAAVSHPIPNAISLGMPRLLGTTELTDRLERAIAALTGQEAALVFTSTNHASRDGLGMLAGKTGHFLIDGGAYPISVDAAFAAARGESRVHRFTHNDPDDLERLLRRYPGHRNHVIICDGVYPGKGTFAPLPAFLELAECYGASLYIDDAHGIGVLGRNPTRAQPLGIGGSGTPSRFGLGTGSYLHIGGLSKAFGIPIAFAAGPNALIDRLRSTAPSFVHNSPPAIPLLAAALAALDIHQREGDDRRSQLIAAVRRFRAGLRHWDLRPEPHSCFPIQGLRLPTVAQARAMTTALRRRSIWTLLQHGSPDAPQAGAVRFVFSAAHRPNDIDEAVEQIAKVSRARAQRGRG